MAYSGDFFDGKKHGFGKSFNSKGDVEFEGIFLDGKPQEGIPIEEKRSERSSLSWKGRIVNGEANGYAKEYIHDELKYEGLFVDGRRQGRGMSDIYSDKAIGNFVDGWLEGKGKKYNSEWILKYEGEYSKGSKNGEGKTYRDDGMLRFEGFHEQGEFRNGTLYEKDGSYYVGEMHDFEKHGMGKEYDAAGKLLYEGRFENGERKE
jgi:hypothetical protein